MLENFYKDPATIERTRQSQLGPYLSSFLEQATQLGYVPSTVKSQLCLLSVLSNWLERHGVSVKDFDESIAIRIRKQT